MFTAHLQSPETIAAYDLGKKDGARIPDGWKLVPREATIGMCENAYGGAFETTKQLDWFKAQWRDYLEVVPE